MQLIFQCPRCQQRNLNVTHDNTQPVSCTSCDWVRDEGAQDFEGEQLCRCRICGCTDLWRQKDFPPALGLVFVGLGILLSSIAWAWHLPAVAIGILMGFACIDLVLFWIMPDMLVCYRCRARHRKSSIRDDHPAFDLEVSERYRQQDLRQTAQSE